MLSNEWFMLLYAVKFGIYMTFAFACFYRAWENHLAHHSIRKALVALGFVMASLGATMGYRIMARSITDLSASRGLLQGYPFAGLEVVATVSLVILFFLLQKPRGDED